VLTMAYSSCIDSSLFSLDVKEGRICSACASQVYMCSVRTPITPNSASVGVDCKYGVDSAIKASRICTGDFCWSHCAGPYSRLLPGGDMRNRSIHDEAMREDIQKALERGRLEKFMIIWMAAWPDKCTREGT
jgi:hypothetical protein